ncbi:copper chaperone PCu(A)C [Halomonas alkaliantarctica]|uniref:copper chaperone PCu(A)C n=1 Tax=Halomonas alkaliantarctica TaxID=232346 RepID=UPI00265AD45B|nr:copper chaperone PCu(A)C [Halomonas alkaliantarctica]
MLSVRSTVLALSAIVFTSFVQADSLIVENPFVREVPPGSPATAAFMTLYNQSDAPVRLIEAQNSITEYTELHDHVVIDEVMQMRQVEAIEIPAQGKVTLAPGGLHLMLIGLSQPVNTGGSVSLNLFFDNGDGIEVVAPIRSVMPMHQ